MTLKELFEKEQDYQLIIKIPKSRYSLYVEGLNEFGEMISNDFDIEKIKTFCIEIFDSEELDYIATIDSFNIKLTDNINTLFEKANKYIEEV